MVLVCYVTFNLGHLGNLCVVDEGSVLETLLDDVSNFFLWHRRDDVFHQNLHAT